MAAICLNGQRIKKQNKNKRFWAIHKLNEIKIKRMLTVCQHNDESHDFDSKFLKYFYLM